ncbi:hypothetical protein [Desulfosporosinus sp. Sb-LF]|uniref:hypothetical protein n=1 Tax=Desulfosporosinus sp. Sb-LF TaxID=2560027 RepID=UPI00107F5231|nr:hypothetical protein [Desulfosporosinus sp. Sb-LF]TGE33943.1 hypothetical protein E4K68_03810 [Desulfosporosinus sp. Sb-LF]
MIRSSFISLWIGTAFILLAIAVTGNLTFLGGLIGYWVGFTYTLWFHREALRSSELEIRLALNRMRRNFLARLGMVTLVVVAVARFRGSWLFSLAIGIVTGVIISFIIVAILKTQGERGEK